MTNELNDIRIEPTLPKPWEEAESFNDVLYDWMSRAPWFLISAALHFVIGVILAAMPWSAFEEPEEQGFTAHNAPPPEEPIEEDVEEIEDPVEEPSEEEPILEDFEVSDHNETITDDPHESTESNTNDRADSPFDKASNNPLLGIGGAAGGKMGGRFGGDKNLRAGDSTNVTIQRGLQWLADHQDENGQWDCDAFFKHDPANDKTDGPGDALHDVGVTGLALLAFLGDGHTTTRGKFKDVVTKGVKWLLDEQNRESGVLGEPIGHSFLYDHAIATLALCEVHYIDKSPLPASRAQLAVNYILDARNPYEVWRYAVPPNGQNDTSVTGWMVFALKSAEEGGLKVPVDPYRAAITWFDDMTDPSTGRVGYTAQGSQSARVTGLNDRYPTDHGEALTAVTLLSRFFLGQDPENEDEGRNYMHEHADLLRKTLPQWSEDGLTNDMYYWYYGSYAMWQMGGDYWQDWEESMRGAVLDSQRRDGSANGSWDPNGPWGYSGGRVYSTAIMVLCLEVYYRYGRILGSR